MEHLDEELSVVEQRRRAVAPVETKLAVVLLHVSGPHLVASEVKRGHDPGAGENPNVGAVGGRRGRRHVVLARFVVAPSKLSLPANRALPPVDRPPSLNAFQ